MQGQGFNMGMYPGNQPYMSMNPQMMSPQARMMPTTPVGNLSPGIEVGRRVIDEPVTIQPPSQTQIIEEVHERNVQYRPPMIPSSVPETIAHDILIHQPAYTQIIQEVIERPITVTPPPIPSKTY